MSTTSKSNDINLSRDTAELAEHYKNLCIRLTEKAEKVNSKASRRKDRLRLLQKENSDMKKENATLKLKLAQLCDSGEEENEGDETKNDKMKMDDTKNEKVDIEQNQTSNESTKTSDWKDYYSELVIYKEEHGDCDVPALYEKNQSLSNWVHYQRTLFKYDTLSKDQVKMLDDIGFVWEISHDDASWYTYYNSLVSYKWENGDCYVPSKYTMNIRLGNWVRNQREAFRNETLSQDHIRKLNAIGFVWNKQDINWTKRYEELICYKAQWGDCNVERLHKPNKKLGSWVYNQRYAFRRGTLSKDRENKLNEIGFIW